MIDDICPRLANAASADEKLRALLKVVANGSASVAELTEFQRLVDATAEVTVTPEGDRTKPKHPSEYTEPFLSFINENPTVFHAVAYFEAKLHRQGFQKLNERENWATGSTRLECGGKYFVTRNGSSLIAFVVGESYKVGDKGIGMIAGHIDALTARGNDAQFTIVCGIVLTVRLCSKAGIQEAERARLHDVGGGTVCRRSK